MHIAQMKPTTAGKQLIKQHYYRIVPLALDYYTNLNNTDRRLLSDIYTMYIEGHLFYKSNRILSKAMNISRRSITRCVQKVSKLGFISTYYAKNNTRYIYLTKQNLNKLVIKQTTAKARKAHQLDDTKVPKVVREHLRQNQDNTYNDSNTQSNKTGDDGSLASKILHQEDIQNRKDTKKIIANIKNESEPQRTIDVRAINQLRKASGLPKLHIHTSTSNKTSNLNKNKDIKHSPKANHDNVLTINKISKPTLAEQNMMNQQYAKEHHGHIKLRGPLPKSMHSVSSLLRNRFNQLSQQTPSKNEITTYKPLVAKHLNMVPLSKFKKMIEPCSDLSQTLYTTARILTCMGFRDLENQLGQIFDSQGIGKCTITHRPTNAERLKLAVQAMKYRQLSYYLSPNNKYYHKVTRPLKSIMYNYSPKQDTSKLMRYYKRQWKKLRMAK